MKRAVSTNYLAQLAEAATQSRALFLDVELGKPHSVTGASSMDDAARTLPMAKAWHEAYAF